MTTGKTIVLTRQTFVGKVMSLLLNMLSRLVIAFLPGSKPLLTSWLQSPSAVILEPKKSLTVSTVSLWAFPPMGSRWVFTPSWLSGSWGSFSHSSSVYSCHLFLISSASVRACLSFIVLLFCSRPKNPGFWQLFSRLSPSQWSGPGWGRAGHPPALWSTRRGVSHWAAKLGCVSATLPSLAFWLVWDQ